MYFFICHQKKNFKTLKKNLESFELKKKEIAFKSFV